MPSSVTNVVAMDHKDLTKAQRKSKRRKVKEQAKEAVEQVSRSSRVRRPEGVHVYKLDSAACHLLRETPGYTSNKGYLGSLFKGTSMAEAVEDMRTPWFDDWDPVNVIRTVEKLLCDKRMERREREFMAKVGPYFLKDYSDWCVKVHNVYEPKERKWDPDVLNTAFNRVAGTYSSLVDSPMVALEPAESGQRIKLKSSTGYPFFTSDWHKPCVWGDEEVIPFDWGIEVAQDMVESGDYSALEEHVYTLFTRRAPRGITETDKLSERAVQCSPMVERFLGIGIQQSMLGVMKRNNFSTGLNGIATMPPHVREAMDTHDIAFEADYSNFDATIHPELITRVMLEVILPLFDPKDHPRIYALAEFYSTAALWTPEGVIWSDEGPGLLSGSMLTNVIGTIVGEVAWEYFRIKVINSGESFEDTTFGYGDDLAVFCTTSIPPEELATTFSRYVNELNLIAHPEKQWVSTGDDKEVSFLGCVFFNSDPVCQPVYPIMRLLPKMIWFEHFGGVGDEGDHRAIYEADGLTYTEKLLNGIVGRLDVSVYNASFEGVVEFFRTTCRITAEKCVKFLPDPEASPSLSLINRMEKFFPLPPDEHDLQVDPLSDEEEELLLELVLEAKEDREGRKILRMFKRKMKISVKERRKTIDRADNRSVVTQQSEEGTHVPPSEGGNQHVGEAQFSVDENTLLDECLEVASARRKRQLLRDLLAWRKGLQDGGKSKE